MIAGQAKWHMVQKVIGMCEWSDEQAERMLVNTLL
jgi:hypothetical protein